MSYECRTEPYQLPGEDVMAYQARMRRLERSGLIPPITSSSDDTPAFDPFAALATAEMVEIIDSSPSIDTSSSTDFSGGGGDFNGGGSDGSW